MKKQIKSSDILRYVYHETSAEENFWIEKLLFEEGHPLVEEFYDFIQMKDDLNQLETVPSSRTIDRIMTYARSQGRSKKATKTAKIKKTLVP